MLIRSAGFLLYRSTTIGAQVFLIQMGGPIWSKRNIAAWSIPKGVINPGEDPLTAARREFLEETGFKIEGSYEPMGTYRQNSTKELTVWALKGDCDPAKLVSTHFTLEWPPKSGKLKGFPEADRGAWFDEKEPLYKIVRGQRPCDRTLFL